MKLARMSDGQKNWKTEKARRKLNKQARTICSKHDLETHSGNIHVGMIVFFEPEHCHVPARVKKKAARLPSFYVAHIRGAATPSTGRGVPPASCVQPGGRRCTLLTRETSLMSSTGVPPTQAPFNEAQHHATIAPNLIGRSTAGVQPNVTMTHT